MVAPLISERITECKLNRIVSRGRYTNKTIPKPHTTKISEPTRMPVCKERVLSLDFSDSI